MGSKAGELQSGEVETLDIPADGLKLKTACSMDIGGSMTKIVYTKDEGDTIKLHAFSYPRSNTKEAIDDLKTRLGGRQPDGTIMQTCGVGFQEYAEYMQQELNITVQVVEEINCFTEAFRFLAARIPIEKLAYRNSPELLKAVPQIAGTIAGGLNALAGDGQHWKVVEDEEPPAVVQYPILLCMLGSGAGLMKMEADGTFTISEQLTRCGRMLLGLSNLLLDTQSFTELIELAKAGKDENLHIQAKHLLHGAGDVYDAVPGDFMVYSFGQALGKDRESFSREDKAAALLSMVCDDLAQCCHLTARASDAKNIFLCGSVVGTSQHLRDEMNKSLLVRDVLNSTGTRCYSHFLRFAGYYGAMGALFRTLQHGHVDQNNGVSNGV